MLRATVTGAPSRVTFAFRTAAPFTAKDPPDLLIEMPVASGKVPLAMVLPVRVMTFVPPERVIAPEEEMDLLESIVTVELPDRFNAPTGRLVAGWAATSTAALAAVPWRVSDPLPRAALLETVNVLPAPTVKELMVLEPDKTAFPWEISKVLKVLLPLKVTRLGPALVRLKPAPVMFCCQSTKESAVKVALAKRVVAAPVTFVETIISPVWPTEALENPRAKFALISIGL